MTNPSPFERCVNALSNFAAANLVDFALQRTTPLLHLGGAQALQAWFTTGSKDEIEVLLKDDGIKRAFVTRAVAEIFTEAGVLFPRLQRFKVDVAASIGPGLGIFEMLYHMASGAKLVLIDIESSAEHAHGYAPNGSGYASLGLMRDFYGACGVSTTDIAFCNPRKERLPAHDVDAVISFISMGFHYPCDEYVDYIRTRLRPGGLFVFDKRKAVPDPGWDQLAPLFDIAEKIDASKSERILAVKR